MNAFGRHLAAVILGTAATVGAAAEGARFPDASTPVPLDATPLLATSERGELLYENHCTSCHASIVHIRENRKAKSMGELRGWVTRWSTELKLNWSKEEIEAVAEYLGGRFYKFDGKA